MTAARPVMLPESEDTVSMPSLHVVLDQVDVAFDNPRAVASAGLLLPATLAERLGIRAQVGNPLAMARLCPWTRLAHPPSSAVWYVP